MLGRSARRAVAFAGPDSADELVQLRDAEKERRFSATTLTFSAEANRAFLCPQDNGRTASSCSSTATGVRAGILSNLALFRLSNRSTNRFRLRNPPSLRQFSDRVGGQRMTVKVTFTIALAILALWCRTQCYQQQPDELVAGLTRRQEASRQRQSFKRRCFIRPS